MTRPGFEEWVQYCFTKGSDQFPPHRSHMPEVERFVDFIDPVTLAEHLIRLFSRPPAQLLEYSEEQTAKGIWFLFGSATEYFHAIDHAPPALQIEVYASLSDFYRAFLDRVCNDRQRAPDERRVHTHPIDVAVYMMWDMDSLGHGPQSSQRSHLVEPILGVLKTALFECRSSSCKVSAIHGFADCAMVRDHPEVDEMLDRYLACDDQPDFLVRYAKARGHASP